MKGGTFYMIPLIEGICNTQTYGRVTNYSSCQDWKVQELGVVVQLGKVSVMLD